MSHSHEHGGNIFAVARSLGVSPERILDFSASINPLGMAPGVKDALTASFDRLLHYPDKGVVELREGLAAYHGVAPAEVTVANGSTELIHLLPRQLPGKKALIVAPAFAEYETALARAGWEVDYLVLESGDGFDLPLPRLAEKLPGCDLIFVCNPANPTGALLSRGEIAAILDLCVKTGAFLVLDEAFMDFCEEESAKELVVASHRGVVLRSMTKFFAIPGLRLGYALGSVDTIALLERARDPWSVNTAAEVAGIASLADSGYRETSRSYVAAERARLAEGLEALGGVRVFPSAANYLLVELLTRETAASLRERLMRRGILIRDCSNFRGLDHRFFRVAVRLREENDRLIEALSEKAQ